MNSFAPEIVDLDEQETLAVRGDVPVAQMSDFFGHAFGAVMAAVQQAEVDVVGPPFGYYPVTPTDTVVIEAGMPVAAATTASGEVHRLVLPGGRAVVALHVGPFDTLERTYGELEAWMKEHDLEPATGMWERYLSDMEVDTDPATWRTQIVWPVTGETDGAPD